MSDLTNDQIKAEDEFLKGLPRVNIGALLLPPIWGPAHGFWITILYYPAWLIADNLFYATYTEPTVLSIIFSMLTFALLLGVTIVFSIVSQPLAAHRAEDKGISRETYLKRERYWAVGCVIGGIVLLVLATIYNINIRPTLI